MLVNRIKEAFQKIALVLQGYCADENREHIFFGDLLIFQKQQGQCYFVNADGNFFKTTLVILSQFFYIYYFHFYVILIISLSVIFIQCPGGYKAFISCYNETNANKSIEVRNLYSKLILNLVYLLLKKILKNY